MSSRHLNRVSITLDVEFTTNHQLSDKRLQELHDALASALSHDTADTLLDAVRENVDEDEEPDCWGGYVPNATAASYESKEIK